MSYGCRYFGDYATFMQFCNRASLYYWELHSWQDLSYGGGVIRAVFVQDPKAVKGIGGIHTLPKE